MCEAEGPRIPQFYAGRVVFITGGTGFMGKVLIERLLATCPDVGDVYLLTRQQRDVLPKRRLAQLKKSQVFAVIQQRCPWQLDKLHIVPGDLTQPQLGLQPESLAQLRKVSIVFHCAATVKFNEALRIAVDTNLRSVIQLLDICDTLPHLEAFVHVSTAYSNAERGYIEERVYPPPMCLHELLDAVDNLPEPELSQLTPKFIKPKPNTYTFTKAMAESVVEQHRNRGYSAAIVRPTIVVSSLKHPLPGWIENLNGPSGLIVGAGKGLLRVVNAFAEARSDQLPVDIAIDTLLAVAWETAIDKLPHVRVYNCSTGENPITNRQTGIFLNKHLRQHPLNNPVWYPHIFPVKNRYLFKLLECLMQTIPLHAAQFAIGLFNIQTKLNFTTISKKLIAMGEVLSFFYLGEWRFATDNVRHLRARLTPQDAILYNLDPHSIKWDDHYRNFVRGVKCYLLRESDQSHAAARDRMRRLYLLHYGMIVIALVAMLSRLGFPTLLCSIVSYYFSCPAPYNSKRTFCDLLSTIFL